MLPCQSGIDSYTSCHVDRIPVTCMCTCRQATRSLASYHCRRRGTCNTRPCSRFQSTYCAHARPCIVCARIDIDYHMFCLQWSYARRHNVESTVRCADRLVGSRAHVVRAAFTIMFFPYVAVFDTLCRAHFCAQCTLVHVRRALVVADGVRCHRRAVFVCATLAHVHHG
jgi:hypothetical protein